jgi:hypothetical protein
MKRFAKAISRFKNLAEGTKGAVLPCGCFYGVAWRRKDESL